MTRTLFFLTALAAILAATTAILIRIEHTNLSVSFLFQLADGSADNNRFFKTSVFQTLISQLSVILLGTTMASAARTKGSPGARFVTGIGCAFAAYTFIVIVLAFTPVPAANEVDSGWVIYQPLSTSTSSPISQSVLGLLPDHLRLDPFAHHQTKLFFLSAAAMLFLGAYAMLATLPSFRSLQTLGIILTAIVTLPVAQLIPMEPPAIYGGFYLALVVPLLICASIRLIDAAPSWLLILTIGVIITSAAQIILLILAVNNSTGTVFDAAALYTFPLGIAFFALPALILFDRDTDLSTLGVTATLAAITIPLTLWVTQMASMDLNGLELATTVDSQPEFAAENLMTTTNIVIFILLYFATITAIRRATR